MSDTTISLPALRVTVLGAGKMGGALATGWIQTGVLSPENLRLCNRRLETAQALAQILGASSFASSSEAVADADVVILGVKPYAVVDSLKQIHSALSPQTLILSVAAGVPLEAMQDVLPPETPLIRAMPNTPALVGAGATAFCRGSFATENHAHITQQLFGAVGYVAEVTEPQLDAVIGVSGSGVAYLYLLCEALIDGGVLMGLPRDISRPLAAQTMLGAARMILQSETHPGSLKDAVTTPGGTTIHALHVLEKAGVRGTLMDAVQAAHDRAKQMAQKDKK